MIYSTTEKEIASITVHGSKCFGCKKHKKDIMITYTSEGSDEVIDLFLTTKQVKSLMNKLKIIN